jgi:hypothetical protein
MVAYQRWVSLSPHQQWATLLARKVNGIYPGRLLLGGKKLSVDAAARGLFSRVHPPPTPQHLRSHKEIGEQVLLELYRADGIKSIRSLRELLKQGRRRSRRPNGLLKGERPLNEHPLAVRREADPPHGS